MYHNTIHPYPLNHSLLEMVQHCEATCENTDYLVLQMGGAVNRTQQLKLLRDCADICTLMAKYLAHCSHFYKNLAALCANICEICGNHCLQHPDEVSQRCGQTCLHCAQQCRAFSMGA